MEQCSGGDCIARDIVAGRRRRRRRSGRRRAVAAMAEANTDEQTQYGTEERPEDGVEHRPAVYGGCEYGAGLDVPRVVVTRHRLATSVSRRRQLTTEIVDSLAIDHRVTGTLVQSALQTHTHTHTHTHVSPVYTLPELTASTGFRGPQGPQQ